MRNIVLTTTLLATFIGTGIAGAQTQGTVQSMGDGWYRQQFKELRATYLVDAVSRTCFISYAGGVSSVSCRGVSRRPEWKAIITWE